MKKAAVTTIILMAIALAAWQFNNYFGPEYDGDANLLESDSTKDWYLLTFGDKDLFTGLNFDLPQGLILINEEKKQKIQCEFLHYN